MPEPEFREFDSLEDAWEFMRKGEAYGNRNLHPKQAAITWGDHWVRFYDIADRMIIFGYIYTPDEVEASEAEGIDKITDLSERMMARAEVAESMRSIRDSHSRGLMWGWAYSKHFTDLGSTHRFNMWPCSEELFEAAKAVGWDVDALTDPVHRRELERSWQEYRQHMLAVAVTGDAP
jgi:hypothetical protein